MDMDGSMRASDQDREAIAELLCDGYAEGRLTGDELNERLGNAFQAKTWAELRDLTADLPVVPGSARLFSRGMISRRGTRHAGQIIWGFALVLAAGLAGRVFPAAVWAAAILACLALVLPLALRGTRPRSGPTLPAVRQRREHDQRPFA
jgi:hypothetical protein